METWTLPQEPVLEIGVREGEEAYQLHRAEGSARLQDGRIVVANGGSRELRFFDDDGRYLKAVGGEGDGPGEFRFPARVRKAGPDTLLVWDQSLRRLSYFGTGGEFLGSHRLLPDRDVRFPLDEWLFGRFWIDSPLRPSARGPIRRAAETIPLPDSLQDFFFLKVTEQGRIWASEVRPPADTALTWTIYDLEGVALATAQTPPRFEPHEIGPDYVLGLFMDELDVNYIHLYALEKPPGSSPGPGLDSSVPAERPRARPTRTAEEERMLAPMKDVLKILASLEEIHYADHYSYTTNVDELFSGGSVRVPEGMAVDILFATGRGWMGTVTDTETGLYCALAYGQPIPMGWQAGELICP